MDKRLYTHQVVHGAGAIYAMQAEGYFTTVICYSHEQAQTWLERSGISEQELRYQLSLLEDAKLPSHSSTELTQLKGWEAQVIASGVKRIRDMTRDADMLMERPRQHLFVFTPLKRRDAGFVISRKLDDNEMAFVYICKSRKQALGVLERHRSDLREDQYEAGRRQVVGCKLVDQVNNYPLVTIEGTMATMIMLALGNVPLEVEQGARSSSRGAVN